jgi:hypothetical protein
MPLVLLPGFFSADCRVFPEACDALLELTELSLRAAASGSAKGRFSTCLFMRRPVNGVDVHLVRNRDRLAAEAPRPAVGVLRRHLAPLSLHAALPCVEIAVASPKSSSRSVGSTCCDARSNAARAWSNVVAEPERCVLGSMPG